MQNLIQTEAILKTAEELAGLIRVMCAHKDWAEQRIAELEEICNRIAHEMERPRCKYKERAKLATELAAARRERRALKDWVHENQPYLQWRGTDNGVKTQAMIANLVSVGRRVKNAKQQREAAQNGN